MCNNKTIFLNFKEIFFYKTFKIFVFYKKYHIFVSK